MLQFMGSQRVGHDWATELTDSTTSSVRGILQARVLECCTLLQGIFLTQGLNSDLLQCKQILSCLGCQGSPRGWQPDI